MVSMHTLVGGEGAGGSCRGAGVRCRSEVQGCRCWVLRVRVVGVGGGCGGAGGRCRGAVVRVVGAGGGCGGVGAREHSGHILSAPFAPQEAYWPYETRPPALPYLELELNL